MAQQATKTQTLWTTTDHSKHKALQKTFSSGAQSIGRPTRQNCGSCHFKGGGGDGVKHGDLDTSLTRPNKPWMFTWGPTARTFDCTRCHTTALHNIAGRVYTRPAATDRKSLIEDDLTAKITCESCHSSTPHKAGVQSQRPHGQGGLPELPHPGIRPGEPHQDVLGLVPVRQVKGRQALQKKDEFGKDSYDDHQGQMKWAKNVKPEYYWFNGSINTTTAKDTIDPSQVVISHPVGTG
jgi:hypothetical protein